MYNWEIIDTTNFIEPVTLAQAKLYCKIDDDYTHDDDVFNNLISAAREAGELESGLAFGLKTVTFTANDQHDFPLYPVRQIISVKDQYGNDITDPSNYPFYLMDGTPIWYSSYKKCPTLYTVVYLAGYGEIAADPESGVLESNLVLPEGLRTGVLKLVQTYYNHPDDIEVSSVRGSMALDENSIRTFRRFRRNPLF
jgi:hypothetical protein